MTDKLFQVFFVLRSAVFPVGLAPLFVVDSPNFGLLLLELHLDRLFRLGVRTTPVVVEL